MYCRVVGRRIRLFGPSEMKYYARFVSRVFELEKMSLKRTVASKTNRHHMREVLPCRRWI